MTEDQAHQKLADMERIAVILDYNAVMKHVDHATRAAAQSVETLIGHFCAAVRDHMHGCTDDGRQRLLDYYNHVIKQYPGDDQ